MKDTLNDSEVQRWVFVCEWSGVLQAVFGVSKHLYAPPQVYEHVYETVDINSSPEVRASATAKVG